jgi:hypothetical protein
MHRTVQAQLKTKLLISSLVEGFVLFCIWLIQNLFPLRYGHLTKMMNMGFGKFCGAYHKIAEGVIRGTRSGPLTSIQLGPILLDNLQAKLIMTKLAWPMVSCRQNVVWVQQIRSLHCLWLRVRQVILRDDMFVAGKFLSWLA